MPVQSSIGTLRVEYQRGSESIRESFLKSRDGAELVKRRSALIDHLVERLWLEHIAAEEYGPQGLTLAAIGGYGRSQLSPFSDIDLLFLFADATHENSHKAAIRRLCQDLWDIGLRVSSTSRTMDECERVSEENPEFTLALLDRRYLAGDFAPFEELDLGRIPTLIDRHRQALLEAVAQLLCARHAKFQGTLFHLEPNVKDGPGGLRDFHVSGWLSQLLPDVSRNAATMYERNLLVEKRDDSTQAHEFLLAVRGFLHYRSRRDDNMLYWQAQNEAAALGIGFASHAAVETPMWMRQYFRHARSIDWLARQLLGDIPSGRSSFIDQVRQWRSRTVIEGCLVADKRISLRSVAEYSGPARVMVLFQLLAELGLQLSREAEGHISEALPVLAEHLPEGNALWEMFRRVLVARGASSSLRAMHALGILDLILPEFHGVDALVVRDAYHRYTVDEHTFLIIENLHALEQPGTEWEQRFAEILRELEDPALLYLAALLHDTGKARSEAGHTEHSAAIAEAVLDRWQLAPSQREAILRLIRMHLEMSLATRKDIFDAETVRDFAELVSTPQNLRLLALLTYADIQSVHPDALTAWKAETLWRLYIAASNYLDRNVDQDRIAPDADTTAIQNVTALMPAESPAIHAFLAGLPQRYLRTRAATEVLEHWRMAHGMPFAGAEAILRPSDGWWECTIVTHDRAFLFADLAGALTAWGMDIIKADAFSNAAGLVIDTFRFRDRYRTLELNPSEVTHFRQNLRDVGRGAIPVERLLTSRAHAIRTARYKTRIETRLSFDTVSSTHSTILQVIAQDTAGLLRRISVVIAEHRAEIGVALVDTEGEMAIDVFYLTRRGEKLEAVMIAELQQALAGALAQTSAA